MPIDTLPAAAMEMAAKYICNHHCGRCPLLVVNFPCPSECTLDTLAWHCWIEYFRGLADKAHGAMKQSDFGEEGASRNKTE